MKKLLSSLLVFTMCLSQGSLVGHSQENYGEEGERPVNKGSLNSFNVENDKKPEYSKDESETYDNLKDYAAEKYFIAKAWLSEIYDDSKKWIVEKYPITKVLQLYSIHRNIASSFINESKNFYYDTKNEISEGCECVKAWAVKNYVALKIWLNKSKENA